MNATITASQRTRREALSMLERAAVGILLAMVAIWTVFQVVEIQALFPPIGLLYAIGSAAIAMLMLLGRKRWAPGLAAGWALLMMIPESFPAIGHLVNWDEIYTHFGHYLIIVTFFPLAIVLTVLGVRATIQNSREALHRRPAPDWLRGVLIGTAAFIVAANAMVVALYLLEIP